MFIFHQICLRVSVMVAVWRRRHWSGHVRVLAMWCTSTGFSPVAKPLDNEEWPSVSLYANIILLSMRFIFNAFVAHFVLNAVYLSMCIFFFFFEQRSDWTIFSKASNPKMVAYFFNVFLMQMKKHYGTSISASVHPSVRLFYSTVETMCIKLGRMIP